MSDNKTSTPIDGSNDLFRNSLLDSRRAPSPGLWDEMRSFLAIARAGSLLGAVDMLGVSQPTLSRRLMTLEDRLGQLVIRKPHGVELTTKGREIAERIAKIDHDFADLFAASSAPSYRSVVKVAATDGLAAFWLSPHIPGLLQKGLHVSLDVISLQNIPDLKKNEVDIVLAFPVPVQDDFIVEDLGTMHLTTFASLEYIKHFGTPTRDTLNDHQFVGNRQYLSMSDFWQDWVSITKQAQYIAGTDMNVTYATMIKSGLGLGLLGNYMNLDPYLVHVDLGVNIHHGIRMFSLEQKRNDAGIAATKQWIRSIFRGNPWFSQHMVTTSDVSDYDQRVRWLMNHYSV
ncbi:MAG: LysR family transcriptional regulator [Alphaproteobacteria bacterium]